MRDRYEVFKIANIKKGAVAAEIGVHKGEFSQLILDLTDPKELHLIDPWRYESSEKYKSSWYGGLANGKQEEMDSRYFHVLNKFNKNKNVHIHRSTSQLTLNSFQDSYFDWIYIDGNHSYEFVLDDLILSYKKIKKGGVIIGDDYITSGWWGMDIINAVKKFTTESQLNFEIFEDQYIIYC